MSEPRAIKIAVTAMGGQGGGVLASWIVKLGESAGYLAQSTSVPGVAQRTGATVYYVELFPNDSAKAHGKAPVLALMPASGDVDIVLAAEFMEAGRAITRGFVSDRTTLIASSHRDYAIAEKIGMGDARQHTDNVREAAKKAAGRFIEADMARAAAQSSAVISAVMFGALAGSRALPVSREVFENVIKSAGRAVEANLCGFGRGYELASTAPAPSAKVTQTEQIADPSPAAEKLLQKMERDLPPEVHTTARSGLARCVDYQDANYAEHYLDLLKGINAADKATGPGQNFRLTNLAAKRLALWMTYEDAIRVADLKTRVSRFDRVREDIHAEDGQIFNVYEYMHPRVEEVCDILPAGMARGILKGKRRQSLLKALLGGGKRMPTTKLRGFIPLWMLSKLRFLRRHSFRFQLEQIRIRQWIGWITQYAAQDYEFACEVASMQRLLKGYGDTHVRGLANYNRIMARIEDISLQPNPAQTLADLHHAALKDEHGNALAAAFEQLSSLPQAAA